MPFLMLIGLLSLSFTAAAQYDAGGQNTHGADLDPGRLDPAAKARLRTEGAVDGTQGHVTNETSSDREAARGARGGSAKEDSAAQK